MITALDTSVLVAIAKAEPSAVRWARALESARNAGDLVICDIVAAELYAFWQDDAAYDAFIGGLGARFLPVDENAAREAGRIFALYRRQGGRREHLVPDFLVAASALRQSDQIAAVDRGYLRRYFPKLKIVKP
jgi:predicted nucleic acid-binding protein